MTKVRDLLSRAVADEVEGVDGERVRDFGGGDLQMSWSGDSNVVAFVTLFLMWSRDDGGVDLVFLTPLHPFPFPAIIPYCYEARCLPLDCLSPPICYL
ncbi:hypothetical protein NL676_038712 [Syzygium grande]|nr:hypothetical protein NL676_038712 [Syzygium grande]